jgi:3-oxoacyl-[acyl-carrier-protein] synthase-3
MLHTISGVSVKGIQTTIPRNVVKVESYADVFGEKEIRRIIKGTGFEELRIVNEDETTSDLCFTAAKALLEKLEISPDSIDGLVFISQTPDYKLPATSNILQNRLNLSRNIVAMDINQGCSGYIYGLYLAASLVAAGGCRHVLVCVGDTISKTVNPSDRSARIIFGDAGSATIVEKGNQSFSFNIQTDGSGYSNLIIPAGGYRDPYSQETTLEKIDENGNLRCKNNLFMNGMEIMNFTLRDVPVAINELLLYNNLTKDQIELYALHQANKLIVQSIAKKMGIALERAPFGANRVGNTSSASIPLLLSSLRNSSQCELKTVMACGFGVGLSIATAILDLSNTTIMETIDL